MGNSLRREKRSPTACLQQKECGVQPFLSCFLAEPIPSVSRRKTDWWSCATEPASSRAAVKTGPGSTLDITARQDIFHRHPRRPDAQTSIRFPLLSRFSHLPPVILSNCDLPSIQCPSTLAKSALHHWLMQKPRLGRSLVPFCPSPAFCVPHSPSSYCSIMLSFSYPPFTYLSRYSASPHCLLHTLLQPSHTVFLPLRLRWSHTFSSDCKCCIPLPPALLTRLDFPSFERGGCCVAMKRQCPLYIRHTLAAHCTLHICCTYNT